MQHGETIHSMLPQDIPWWMPDHAIFFGVLYAVLFVISTGLSIVLLRTLRELKNDCGCSEHQEH